MKSPESFIGNFRGMIVKSDITVGYQMITRSSTGRYIAPSVMPKAS